ncbi:hypothetical protein ATCVNEJV3_628L [Acanthocystis turfacea Chlorella virus NE-JV-3]|nr:hypothetical protein ATCVNEJV3_628L [Acanthocystis turfacea Chlorella virus NE-JV-3]
MILRYYSNKGDLTVFSGYTIVENGVVTNVATGRPIAQHKNASGYAVVKVRHDGKQRTILVARALASTFLGPPSSVHHTADHIDRDRSNDTLENVQWASTSAQANNQTRPSENKSAFVIVKDGVERTAKEWVAVYAKLYGTRYVENTIREFAREQRHGFGFKVFDDLPGEEWKAVPDSKNKKGEWFISTTNRVKYKTAHAENVLTVEQLSKVNGYPVVKINGKIWLCHVVSMMTFHPEEYAAKRLEFVILHENDNKLDFNPSRLRWGSLSENGFDAHDNGRYDGTKTARKPIASHVNGVLEKEHVSIIAAARYLRENGYPKATFSSVRRSLSTDTVRYGRTWKTI